MSRELPPEVQEYQDEKALGEKRGGQGKTPTFAESIGVVAAIAGVITVCILMLGLDAHIPIFLCVLFVTVLGLRLKNTWEHLEAGFVSAINASMSAFFILMLVGILVGVWMISGVISTMIDYGLAILSPKIFLIATYVICSIVALATGTSWGTAASIGVALVGVGAGLGIPAGMTGGAIVAGAYFGDKMSPLSDTTNLAPAVSGAKLYDHIGAMIYTTGPTWILAGAAFIALSLLYGGGDFDPTRVNQIREALASVQKIHPLLLLPPLCVIGMALLKIPAVPGMFVGIVTGALCGMVIQGVGFVDMMTAANYGYEGAVSAEVFGEEIAELVNGLLTRGGLQNMMWTISLSWMAIGFGGMLEAVGYLHVILHAVVNYMNRVGNLVTATLASCFAVNLLIGDQYLAIILPGRLFRPAYEELGLEPRMLSRTLEDAGTLTSPLVPWNACGAYMAGTLGIPTLTYAPYAILNWLNPFVSAFIAYAGFKIFWREGYGPAAKNDAVPAAGTGK